MDLKTAYANWNKWRDKPDGPERSKAQEDLYWAAYQQRKQVGDKGKLGVEELESYSTEDFKGALSSEAIKRREEAKAKTKVMNKLKKDGPPEPVDIQMEPITIYGKRDK